MLDTKRPVSPGMANTVLFLLRMPKEVYQTIVNHKMADTLINEK